MKYYKINEDELLQLLKNTEILNCLECGGVDNWIGYMENWDEYISDALGTTKDNVCEEDLDFRDIAKELLKKYELIEEKGE